jgi:hypothetical protein
MSVPKVCLRPRGMRDAAITPHKIQDSCYADRELAFVGGKIDSTPHMISITQVLD